MKTSALDMHATTMSGGNQQKVVLAKWLATEPKLLIIDEPTRGIDVGTKAEVHRLLSDLAGEGLAILMISSELPEVLGMADRVLVVCEGRITAELARDEATPEARHARRDRLGHPHRRPAAGGDGMSDTLLVEPSAISPTRRILGGLLRSREIAVAAVLVARHRVDHDQEPELPVQQRRLARPAAHAVAPAAARGRPDGRDHHPQRRPVGRLDPRADGVPHRQAVRRPPGHPDRGVVLAGSWRWARCSAWSTASWSRSARCRPW